MAANGKFPYSGTVDADGHILEPPDTWEKYIDPKYKDRTIRLRTNEDGLEVLELNGRPAKYSQPGQLAQFGAMGKKVRSRNRAPSGPHLCWRSALRLHVPKRAAGTYGSRGFG